MPNKIDSNSTGLSFAEESAIGVLPGTPTWHTLEPNSYSEFGAKYSTKKRNPINNLRKNKKASLVGMDVSAGFSSDLTQNSLTRLMQSFCFAAARETPSTAPLNGTGVTITGVTTSYNAAAGLGSFKVNHLVLATGFGLAANNGLKLLTAATATALTATGVAAETPPAGHKLEAVGYQFPSADVAMSVVGGMAVMTSTAANLNTLGLIPGQWVFLGGDAAAEKWTTNVGFARIKTITAAAITFDKTDWTPAVEAGAGKTIRMFWGTVIRDEDSTGLITRRTVQLERSLGSDGSGTQSEYVKGAVANTLQINMPQEDKITADLAFVGIGHETRDGATGLKSGNRPTLAAESAFNTSSNFARIKMAVLDSTTSNPEALVGFITDMNLAIGNNVMVNKALGTLGGFDTSAGNFDLTGKVTAYFTNFNAVNAVKNNSEVTLDVVMVKDNAGLLFDIPEMTLGNGLSNVEQDKAIMVPVDGEAYESDFGHTFLYEHFSYLPSIAAA